MRINELMDFIAEICLWSFQILEKLNNNFNWLIIAVMSVMGIIWVKKMADFNREAREKGTLK